MDDETDKINLLLIEDNPGDARLIQEILYHEDQRHFNLISVDRLAPGLEKLATSDIKLVLLDLSLPDSQGLETVRRALACKPEVSLVVLTGMDDEDLALKALETGAQDYLVKGEVTGRGLIRTIRHAIERQRDVIAQKQAQAQLAIQARLLEQMYAELQRSHAELERRVAERTAQLEAANKELEAFAYSVSHDLRAPLRHITGFIEILQNRAANTLDTESRRYLTRINNAAASMGAMIEHLLSFSRIGRAELTKVNVDFNITVRAVILDLQMETKDRQIVWHVDALPPVSGDPALLRLVWVNLISNAIKYTRPKPQAEITIGYQANPGESVFFIRDDGVGFDMTHADKLFGVFQRLHPSSEFEGNGIGLANVQRIISRHGGRVWAEGEVDKGATFYFSMPKEEEKESR